MNLSSNRWKSGLVSVLLLLVLSFGVFGHPADPNPAVAKFALFATDSIFFGNQSADTLRMPAGPIGTNGIIDMHNITYYGVGKIYFYNDIFIKNTFLLPGSPENIIQLVNNDTNYCYMDATGAFIPTGRNYPNFNIDQTTTVPLPVSSSDAWYLQWPADSIPTNNVDLTNGTIPPGTYGKIIVSGSTTFQAGVYNINELVLRSGGVLTVSKTKDEICRIFVKENLTFDGSGINGVKIKSSLGDEDLGKILIYTTDTEFSTNQAAATQWAAEINASIVAPRAKINFLDNPTIRGQVLARTIHFKGYFDASAGEFVPFDPSKISLIGAADFEVTEDNDGDQIPNDSRLVTIPVQLAAPMNKNGSVKYRIDSYSLNASAIISNNTGTGDIDTSYNGAHGSGTLHFDTGNVVSNESIQIWVNDDARIADNSQEWETEYFYLYLYEPDTALLAADPDADSIYYASNGKTVDSLRYRIPVINDDQNSSPVVNDISITVIEGGDTTFTITNLDPDLPTDTTILSILSGNDASNGNVTFNLSSITYDHNGSENFTDQFKVIVTDKANAKDTFTVNVTIIPDNDISPIGKNDTIVVYEEGDTNTLSPSGNISLLSNGDYDPESYDSISLGTILINGKLGTLAFVNLSTGTFTYTHTSNSETLFSDTVTYTIKDGAGNLDTVKAFITIIPVNDNSPTVLNNVTISINEDTTATYDSTNGLIPNSGATDADLPNNNFGLSPLEKLSVIAHAGTTAKGTFAINSNGSYSYSANDESYGLDSIPFIVQDNHTPKHTADTAYLIVNIIPGNDNAPITFIGYMNVDENSSVDSLINGVKNVLHSSLVTDADLPNDSLYVSSSLSFTTANGIATFTINNDGTFSYNYTADTTTEIFSDTVKYTVSDKDSKHSADVTIIVTINPVNDNNPQAEDDVIILSAVGDSTTLLATNQNTVLYNDNDIDVPDSFTVVLIEGAKNGTLTLNTDGTFKYVHNGSADTTDSAFYEITDGAGHKDTAKIDIAVGVTFVNEPTALPDTIVVDEGGTAVVLKNGNSSVTENDNANDVLDQLTATIVDSPSFHSSFTLNPSGTFSYTHNNQEQFIDSFTYLVTDLGNQTATGKVHIIINPVNDNTPEPEIDTLYVLEGLSVDTTSKGDTSLLDNDSDLDLPYDSLHLALNDTTTNGSIALNPNGTFLYTHNGEEVFTDQFSYTIYDANTPTPHSKVQIVDVIIIPLNDKAPITQPDTIIINEGDTTSTLSNGTTNLLLNDNDDDTNDTLKAGEIISGPFNGSITIDSSGEFVYIHDHTENFTDSVLYIVVDKGGNKDTSKIVITINPVNDNAPIGVMDSIIVFEGGDTSTLFDGTLSLLANDSDIDINTTLTVSILDSTLNGLFELDEETGTFTYYHDDSENFDDSLNYIVTDGLFKDTVKVKINIIPVNDNLPIVYNDTITLFEGDSTIVLDNGDSSVLDNDTDIDGMTTVTALLTEDVVVGSLTLNSDGTFKYKHNGTENYHDEFKYVALDGGDTTIEATVTIIVTPIPKPSLINAASYYDINGDGYIDSLWVEFTRPISLLDNSGTKKITTFKIKWDSLSLVDLLVDSSNISGNGYIMSTNISNLFNILKTSGTMHLLSTFTLNNPITGNDFDTTVIGVVSDKAAPVITRAEYLFRKIDNPNDLTNSDSLKFDGLLIDFSEPIGTISGDYPFNFQKNNASMDEYQMKLDLIDLTSQQAYFKVDSLIGAFYPDKGDSTWIYADTAYPGLHVSDALGNRQAVSENRRVPLLLEVPDLDISVKILHLVGKTKPLIPDELKIEGIDFTTGAVIVITSENPGNTQEVIDHLNLARKRVGIFDLVGNEVMSADNESTKYLHMAVKTVNGKPALLINWSGQNSNGRYVSTGSYVVILRISDDPMFQNKEEINKVNVKQYIDE